MSDLVKFIALTLLAIVLIPLAALTDFLHNRLRVRLPARLMRKVCKWVVRKMRVQILMLNAEDPDPIFLKVVDSLYEAEAKYF